MTNSGIRIVRAARQNLRHDASIWRMVRKQRRRIQFFIGLHEPVGNENRLEFGRHRTDNPGDHFLVGDTGTNSAFVMFWEPNRIEEV